MISRAARLRRRSGAALGDRHLPKRFLRKRWLARAKLWPNTARFPTAACRSASLRASAFPEALEIDDVPPNAARFISTARQPLQRTDAQGTERHLAARRIVCPIDPRNNATKNEILALLPAGNRRKPSPKAITIAEMKYSSQRIERLA